MQSMTIEQEIDKLLIYQPEKVKEIIMSLHEYDAKETEKAVHHAILGYHLDEEMMNEALSTIVRYDGMHAPFWSMLEFKDICAKNSISTANEKYNDCDLNFLTQYYFADFKSLGKDSKDIITFIHIAEDKLHDIDNPKACESAYWKAKHRICKHK